MSVYVEIYSSDCKIVFQILDTPQVEQIHGQYCNNNEAIL